MAIHKSTSPLMWELDIFYAPMMHFIVLKKLNEQSFVTTFWWHSYDVL